MQWHWATHKLSPNKIGVYFAKSDDPLDYKDVICAQAKSGNCSHRFDVPGEYFFSSGVVAQKDAFQLAFGGKIVVLPKEDVEVNVEILVAGKQFCWCSLLT